MIPGVSGSMVLMVLGYYSTILSLVTGTVTMLKDLDLGGVIHNCLLLVPFAVGVVLGIFLIAKIIEYLFNRFPCQTYAAIIGLILSSPFAILYSAGCAQRLLHPGTDRRPGAGSPGRLGHLADGLQGGRLIRRILPRNIS